MRLLVASVVVGCLAIPAETAVFHNRRIPRPQNTWEHTFFWLLVHTPHELGQAAVVLCDRGFQQVSWLHLAPRQAVAEETPTVRLPCKQKGPRLSLL